jgi:hypothetical protein
VRGVRRCRRGVSVVVVVTAFALAACTDASSSTPPPKSSPTTATIPGPSTSLTPEQQAAEEAKQAYIKYQHAIDRVYQKGGTNAEVEFPKVASDGELKHLKEQAIKIKDAGWRQMGGVSILSIRADTVSLSAKPAQVSLSVCVDTSTRRAVDSQGRDVTRNTSRYFINSATVTRMEGQGWLVAREDSTEARSC